MITRFALVPVAIFAFLPQSAEAEVNVQLNLRYNDPNDETDRRHLGVIGGLRWRWGRWPHCPNREY